MTTPEAPHPAIGEVMRALDLAIVDWLSDDSFVPLSATPRWFTGAVPWASLPFLEHFVGEARRYLHDHVGEVFASEPFTVDNHGQELLLRARALRVNKRLILAIERLDGTADPRPILRQARQDALEHEQLADKARAIHAPLEALKRAVGALQATDPGGDQRGLIEAAAQALATLQSVAAGLPAARKRR